MEHIRRKVTMAQASRAIEITPVTTRRDKSRFIRLPKRLYAGDANWICPLDLEQKDRLFGNNPFFQHADFQAWIATRNGKTVGRVTAQIDHLHEQYQDEKAGCFGMLEAENDTDVVTALQAAAENWLRQRGIKKIRGPFNLSINEEVGLLIEGFGTPPFVMMGHAPPYMAPALERLDYTKAMDMVTYTVAPDFETPHVMARLVANVGSKIKIRRLNRKDSVREFDIIRDIFNDAWSNNWGFVPFTRAEFAELAKILPHFLDDDYVQIAEVDGRPAAFIVVLPNINEAITDLKGRLLPLGWAKLLWRLKVRHPRTGRVPLMGVRKEFQHSRLGPALAFMVIDAARKPLVHRGVETVEMGWILENNSAMRSIIETIGGKKHKTYRVYEKSL